MSAANPTAAEMVDYMAEHYGSCAKGAGWCYHNSHGCLGHGWKGSGCPHWRPAGWKTSEDINGKT